MLEVTQDSFQDANYLQLALSEMRLSFLSRKDQGLIVIIDGFHLLDDSTVPESTYFARKLFETLEEIASTSTKILLCTSGVRSFLLDVIPGHRRQDEVDRSGIDDQSFVESLKEASLQFLQSRTT